MATILLMPIGHGRFENVTMPIYIRTCYGTAKLTHFHMHTVNIILGVYLEYKELHSSQVHENYILGGWILGGVHVGVD